jgi:glycosyltransferase involved in cell wall biosynthesis
MDFVRMAVQHLIRRQRNFKSGLVPEMIILIGPMTPPVHGQSVITDRVVQTLASDSLPILVLSTSPRPGSRGLRYHLTRLKAYLRCFKALFENAPAPRRLVYLSLSGGWGLFYELALVAIARLNRYDIIFHHHSFAYINRPSLILRAIVKLAGPTQMHIVLCSAMAQNLAGIYRPGLRTQVISNLVFLDLPARAIRRSPRPLTTIGYLSNISFSKGIDRYLDLLADLRASGSQLAGRIAGPYADKGVQQYVERRIREIGGIDYVGAVYEHHKAPFFSSIDLLVFPTRYPHEAQPLVVCEAQAAGVPVAASDRGCIREILGAAGPLLLDHEASDFAQLVRQIMIWENDSASFQAELQRVADHLALQVEQCSAQATGFRALFSAYR